MSEQGTIYHRGDALWISWYANGDRREAVSTLAGKRPGSTTWDDAVKVLQRRLFEKAMAREQRSILPQRIKALTVPQLLAEYETHRLIQGVKRPVDFRCTMAQLGKWWGHLNLTKLTTEDLEREIQAKLEAGMARGTVAQRLHGLYAALRWAVQANKLARVPAAPKLHVPPTPTPLWTEAEVAQVCAATKPWVADIVRFGQLTGWRISEILDLAWERVDLKRGLLYLDDTKTDDPRLRPIEGLLGEILARRTAARRLGCALVFHVDGLPVTDDRFHRLFAGAVARAGLGKRRFHAFRHTLYDTLFTAGVDEYTAQELVGHKSTSSTRRYKRQNVKLMRRALGLVDAARADNSGTAAASVVSITR
jgi:integrase